MRGPSPWRTNRAAVLRSVRTVAEARLWFRLRNRKLGFKFVRQAPIEDYFVDFLCRERKLVVEVDGATHATHAELASDAERTRALERIGYRIVRVTNTDISENIDGVLDLIIAKLESEA
jgi:very-short-patch-repair endonuclease